MWRFLLYEIFSTNHFLILCWNDMHKHNIFTHWDKKDQKCFLQRLKLWQLGICQDQIEERQVQVGWKNKLDDFHKCKIWWDQNYTGANVNLVWFSQMQNKVEAILTRWKNEASMTCTNAKYALSKITPVKKSSLKMQFMFGSKLLI